MKDRIVLYASCVSSRVLAGMAQSKSKIEFDQDNTIYSNGDDIGLKLLFKTIYIRLDVSFHKMRKAKPN